MSNSSRKRRIVEEEEDEEEEDSHITKKFKANDNEIQRTQNITLPTQLSQKGIDEYLPGSIVRIKLKNFVTYSDVEFFPGPRLNVIIGPNGSGKSSIICAIALGLGGGTNLLGRAKQVSDFIKHGCDKALIEIELYGESGKNLVIKREINKDNSGDFKLNGKGITKTDLLVRIKELSVQVDNLCQFLPQDKVVCFAAMTPIELLVETEKAIDINDMHANHMKLIELKKEQNNFSNSFKEQTRILEDLKKLNEASEKEVSRYRERQNYLNTAEDLKKKLLWLEFDLERQRAVDLKADKEKFEGDLKKLQNERHEPIKLIKQLDNELQESRQKITTLTGKATNNEQELQKKSKAKDTCTLAIDAANLELDGLNDRQTQRRDELTNYQRNMGEFTVQLQKLPDEKQLKQLMDQKNNEIRTINSSIGEVNYEKNNAVQVKSQLDREKLAIKKELDSINNKNNARLEAVRKASKDIYDAYQFVKQHGDRFKRPVYGPVCLEINVENEDHANFIETSLPFWLMTSFVFETQEDQQLFLSEVVDKRKLVINTVYLPNQPSFRNEINLNELKRYGITHTLDQTFDANPFVKNAILDTIPLHNIAVGTKDTTKYESEIMETTNIYNLFTPTKNFVKTFSKYGNRNALTRVVSVRPAKLLSGINLQKKNELQYKIDEIEGKVKIQNQTLQQLENQERGLQSKNKVLHEDKNNSTQSLEERKKLYNKILNCQRKIEELEREEDTKSIQDKCKKKIVDAFKQCVAVTNEGTNCLIEIAKIFVERDIIVIQQSNQDAKLQSHKEKLSNIDAKLSDLTHRVNVIKKEFDEVAKVAKQKKARAEKEAPLTDELRLHLFETMGDYETIEEVELGIKDFEEKAKFIKTDNPKVIQEYETRKKEIESYEEKIRNRNDSLATIENHIAKLREIWIKPVESFISKINERFKKFFEYIGCAGSVSLGHDIENPNDYSKYSIDIYVQFRQEEKMKKLDAHVQSGGERSVSTMLFLISLQELTLCPFRVVDEINQGMDQKNERMIFEQIVNTANRPGLPQYFLVTPKLLNNLEYGTNTTVFCVYTGPWGFPQNTFDKALENAIKQKAQNSDH